MPSTSPQILAANNAARHITFLEHLQELRMRLFWVIGFLLITSSLGYAIKDQLIALLMHPLGNQQLYYLTPVGGFSFLIKICFYFGLVVSVPMIIYQLYRYIQPLMNGRPAPMLRYMTLSTALAFGGLAFAYLISLPAALHFLTDFNITNITAMLTVDAYLTFVISYLLGAALLFQIPLVLLIINRITPLKPSQLMKYQRHVILAAFIAAAIISPTPDMVNQAILALPIIIMYQIGIGMVWASNRKRSPAVAQSAATLTPVPVPVPVPVVQPFQGGNPERMPSVTPGVRSRPRPAIPTRLINDFGPRNRTAAALRPTVRRTLSSSRPLASIDGIITSKSA